MPVCWVCMSSVLVDISPSCARNRRPSPIPAPSITVSMKMPQKTPSAVMMLRLRFRAMVCQISFQRSVSKKDMGEWFVGTLCVYLLYLNASIVFSCAAR